MLSLFRVVSFVEGLSYIVLVAIAMPLKYVAGQPEMVKHAGRIHGALFVLFVITLVSAAREHDWSKRAMTTAMIAGFIPLGAFWLEHQFRRGRFPAP